MRVSDNDHARSHHISRKKRRQAKQNFRGDHNEPAKECGGGDDDDDDDDDAALEATAALRAAAKARTTTATSVAPTASSSNSSISLSSRVSDSSGKPSAARAPCM